MFGIGAMLSAVINIVVGYLISINLGLILLVKFIDGAIAVSPSLCPWSKKPSEKHILEANFTHL